MEPSRLLVLPPEGPELQYLIQTDELLIGRDPECSIVFSRAGVSRHHARLRVQGCVVTIEDLKSTNGTRLNGKRIPEGPHVLGAGDCIEIAKFELRYVPPGVQAPVGQTAAEAQTRVETGFKEGKLTTVLAQDPSLLDVPNVDEGMLTVVVCDTSAPRLLVREHQRTVEHRLKDVTGDLVVGRHAECTICLEEPTASSRHAAVRPSNGGFVVQDLGSRNGTRVNGVKVHEHRLGDGDLVRIGAATLVYVDGRRRPAMRKRGHGRRRPVVLVPGFTGTGLWKDGVRIWPNTPRLLSKDERKLLDDLAQATAHSLVREVAVVPGLAKTDAFGVLMHFLRDELDYDLDNELLEFPYDWRSSNIESARKLGEALHDWRSKRANPTDKVTIVAHSMGGLVTRLLLARPRVSDAIERVLFLGTPHLGSPQALQTALAGTGALPFGIGMARVRRIVLSFPSFYQLFPAFPAVEFEDGKPFLPFQSEPDWLTPQRRKYLEEARNVRTLLDSRTRLPVPATCVFGFAQKTLERMVVRRSSDGRLTCVSETRTRCGDGQVPEHSAVFEGAEVHPVRQQHGVLYSDPDFLRRLRYELVERPRGSSPHAPSLGDDAPGV